MDSSPLVAEVPLAALRPMRECVPPDQRRRGNRFGVWGAIAIAILLHIAGLLLVLHSSSINFALRGAGRPVSGTSVQVTLVSEPQPPAPTTPQPRPQPKPVVPTPTRHRSTPVLASHTSTSTNTAEITDPTPAKPVPVEQPATPALPTAQAMPAAINPVMNLPGSQAVKNVKNIACRIPQPVYPSRARRLQQQGNVMLRVTISTSGHISEAKVATSSGIPDLDQSAIEAMLAGTCQPYLEDGQAISVTALQTVAFQLNP